MKVWQEQTVIFFQLSARKNLHKVIEDVSNLLQDKLIDFVLLLECLILLVG